MLHRHLTGNMYQQYELHSFDTRDFKGGMPKKIGQRGADSW